MNDYTCWEEAIKQHDLANAKLELSCQQKPFQTREGIRFK